MGRQRADQRAAIRARLQLLCAQHRQLCGQQQELLAAWTALTVGSAAWLATRDQMRREQRRRQVVLQEIQRVAQRQSGLLPPRPVG